MKYLLCCLFAALLLPAAVVVTTTSEPVEAAPAPEEEQPAPGGEGTVLVTGPDGAQYEIVEVPAEEEPLTAEDLLSFSFQDIPEGDPSAGCASYVAARKVLQGAGGGRFLPDQSVTRGALMVVIHRLAGEPYCPLAVGFPDLGPEDWQFDAVSWALYARIAAGNEDGAFAPDAPVTRAQLAVFLYRYAAYMGVSLHCSGELGDSYLDAAAVPDYARKALSWALENRLYASLVSDTIYPGLPVSRIQLAQVLVALAAREEDPLAASLVEKLPSPVPQSASRVNHDAIQDAVDAAARKYGAVGVQVAVVEDGAVTGVFNYGWAHKGNTVMEADHKIRCASISKVFVGMTAMLLREDGLLDLDGDISPYWGVTARNPRYPEIPITFRSLMSHTSSIRVFGDGVSRSYSAVRSKLGSSAGYSSVMPGAITSWNYNNYAFGVLGMTLELAADRYLDDILDEKLFSAMEIDAAFTGSGIGGTDRIAALYYHGGTVGRSVPSLLSDVRPDCPGGTGEYFAGGLIISAQDLAKLAALLANDGCFEGARLLDAESVALMESRYGRLGDGTYQALPLRSQDGIYGRDTLYYHTGSAYGVYSFFSYDPAARDGVVVLTTGASAAKDSRGIYAVCGEISQYIYDKIA